MEQTKRQVFFSFHYEADVWRAGMIRNMGVVDNSSTFSDNDWEEVKKKSELAIKRWINSQMEMRSCLIVLIGEDTWSRNWVDYEIQTAYKLRKGIVGVYIHKLKDKNGNQAEKGLNPFDYNYTDKGEPLSKYVNIIDSQYYSSKQVYMDIEEKLHNYIENAIYNAGKY